MTCLIESNPEVFVAAETKLCFSFLESQFLLEGTKKTYRLDFSVKKGGLLAFVNKNISMFSKFQSSTIYTGHPF